MVLAKFWCADTNGKSIGTLHTKVLKSGFFSPILIPILAWPTVKTKLGHVKYYSYIDTPTFELSRVGYLEV